MVRGFQPGRQVRAVPGGLRPSRRAQCIRVKYISNPRGIGAFGAKTSQDRLFVSDAMTSSQQSSGDYWDDDWDDDSEVGQTQAYVPQQPQSMIQLHQHSSVDYGDTVSTQAIHSVIPERPIPNIPKKNNKFSTLIKSGDDSFLLGMKVANVPENEKIYIEEADGGHCRWIPRGDPYNCVVTSPKKESKLKGLKSFIVYQLTPTVVKSSYCCS